VYLVLTSGRSGVHGSGQRGQHASHGKAHSCSNASAQSAPRTKHVCFLHWIAVLTHTQPPIIEVQTSRNEATPWQVRRQLSSVSPDLLPALRDALLSAACRTAAGPLRTQLLAALASLAAQWTAWVDVLPELGESLQRLTRLSCMKLRSMWPPTLPPLSSANCGVQHARTLMTELSVRQALTALLLSMQQPHDSGLLDLCAACPGRVLPHTIMLRFLTVLAEEAVSPVNIDSAAPQRMRVGPGLCTSLDMEGFHTGLGASIFPC